MLMNSFWRPIDIAAANEIQALNAL
jgi:hypothetical protein